MDAIEFIKERQRLCQTYVDCFKCPAYNNNTGGCNFNIASGYEATEQIRLLEEWSAAHPHKTRQSEFLKQYPNADLDEDGILKVCPKIVEGSSYVNSRDCGCVPCAVCHKAYWLQEVD